jgi:predicted Zn-dependent peptidase
VLRSIAGEFERLKKELVAPEELRRAKDQLKGSLVLSLESPGARMSNLARQEIYFGRFFSVEELHASIEAVTAEAVQQTALEFFEPRKIAATVVGPLEGFRLTRDLLAC